MRYLAGCSVVVGIGALVSLVLLVVTALVLDRALDEMATEKVHSFIRETHADDEVSVERVDFRWLRMRMVAEGVELRDKASRAPLVRIGEVGCRWPTYRGDLVTSEECSLVQVQAMQAMPAGFPAGVFDMGVDWDLGVSTGTLIRAARPAC